MNWDAVRVWAAAVLLLDAAFGLWNQDRLGRPAPGLNVRRLALIEAAAALVLIGMGWL